MLSLIKSRIDPISLKEKLINALAATFAILILGFALKILPHKTFVLPLIASMGASAFLLFTVPHSPMAQPWPLIGGHLVSAIVAIAITHLTADTILASACVVGGSILAMQLLNCLHPPGAATALAVMAGTQLPNMDLQFMVYIVLGNALILLNLQYRRRIAGDFFAEIFVDAGNVWASPSQIALGDIRWGPGLGIQYRTPAGPLRAEYAWKVDPRPGESRGQFFVSFGVPF